MEIDLNEIMKSLPGFSQEMLANRELFFHLYDYKSRWESSTFEA